MGLGLFGALKVIPWGDVVGAAPSVVRGAQQLWQKVRNDPPEAAAAPAAPAGTGPHEALVLLAARVDTLEARAAAQAREAVAASELIATLAEHNARLIDAVDRLRRIQRWLWAAALVLGLATAATGVALLVGR